MEILVDADIRRHRRQRSMKVTLLSGCDLPGFGITVVLILYNKVSQIKMEIQSPYHIHRRMSTSENEQLYEAVAYVPARA